MVRNKIPTCNISRNSTKAKIVKDCKLVVWYECDMSHKGAFEALHLIFKDIRRNNDVMGGVIVSLAGDFPQMLPVIPRGTRADKIQISLKSSYIWSRIQMHHLTINMRVHVNKLSSIQRFSDGLLQEKNGAVTLINSDKYTAMDRIVQKENQLIENLFPNLTQHFRDHAWLSQRVILALRNENAYITNEQMLRELPSSLEVYKSIDFSCIQSHAQMKL